MILKPKLSVIVPVYNTSKFISKCLDSIMNQNFKNLELIVVNDGSTDNSDEIIRTYVNKYNIKYINKVNGGLSSARNSGLEIATGDYISFIDSDDYIDLNMLNQMYYSAKEYSADIVVCDLKKVDHTGQIIKYIMDYPINTGVYNIKHHSYIIGDISCFACNKIFRRHLFNLHRFKEAVYFEDVYLIPLLYAESNIIYKISIPFYNYLDRDNSITKSYNYQGIHLIYAVNEVINKLVYYNLSDKYECIKKIIILQAYYSFLAYVIFIKDISIKKELINKLKKFIKQNKISKYDIIFYKRGNKNYLFSLPFKKIIFYIICIVYIDIIIKLKIRE